MSAMTLHFVSHQPPGSSGLSLLSYSNFKAVWEAAKVKVAAARSRCVGILLILLSIVLYVGRASAEHFTVNLHAGRQDSINSDCLP